jgi:hypothetical protein
MIRAGMPSALTPPVDPGGNWTQAWYNFIVSLYDRTGAASGSDVAGLAPLDSPHFTGLPLAPTAVVGTNTTQIATCSFVLTAAATAGALPSNAAPLVDGTVQIGTSLRYARQDHVHPTDPTRYAASNPAGFQTATQVTTAVGVETTRAEAAEALLAPKASPSFTGSALVAGGVGVFGHAAPTTQPTTPTTLAQVITLLQSYGFSA